MRTYARFFALVVVTNLLSGVILFFPSAIVGVGIAHLIQIQKGGQPVVEEPVLVLIVTAVWAVGIGITIAINTAIAGSSDYYHIVRRLTAWSSHIFVAAASFVGGSFLTSLILHGRIIFLPG